MADIDPKKEAAQKAVTFIQNGMTIGLGTGSTAYWVIRLLGEKVKEGLAVNAVCTSSQTEKLATEMGIPLVPFAALDRIDLAIDGADEIDPHTNLVKGGGGALLREKIVAYNSRQFIVIADESKLVAHLGHFPLPVEVLPFGIELTQKHLAAFCKGAAIRMAKGTPYVTDNGNHIIDCWMEPIEDPAALNERLKEVPGVLETGLFLKGMADKIIVGYTNGNVTIF